MTAIPVLTDDEMKALLVPSGGPDEGFGALETERGRLPLKAMDVRARVSGLVAHIKLRQTFTNALDEPLEATYIFPLPSRGAVTSFQMAIGDRIIDGVLKERGKARQEYREAIAAGHRAAITEEERPDTFTLRVGNLMPGEDAEVRLTLTAPLPFRDGEATFRFPLVVAPRYIPGTPLEGGSVGDGVALDTDAVPDASRISPPVLLPGFPNPVRLSLGVELDTRGLGADDVRCSLHSVADDGADGRWRRIEVRPGERLDRDFILRFAVADNAVRSALIASPDGDEARGAEGTFQLTLVPPVDRTRSARPRDVVFVLDRSGSMGGWKMIAARRALGRMVDTLTERDRFGVIAFDNSIDRSPGFDGSSLVKATDRNRYRTLEFLARLEARGGTEMAQPLLRAAQALAGGYDDRDRILVLVTDGQVGNEAQILQSLAKPLGRTRVFTLGIDRAVNKSFLERLAALGGGDCELVESEDRLDEVMRRIHRRIDTPVLTEVRIEGDGVAAFGIDPDSLVPKRVPDLFAGAPLTVYGRYRGEPRGRLRVRATDARGGKWEHAIDVSATEQPALGALWARGRLRELEDAYTLSRGGSKKAKRVVEISLRHGVLCRFTAFVAIDRSEVVNAGGERRPITQPVEMPSGWKMSVQTQSPPSGLVAGMMGGSASAVFGRTMAMHPGAAAAPPPAPKRRSKHGLGFAATDFLDDPDLSPSRLERGGPEAAEREDGARRPQVDLTRARRALTRLEGVADGKRKAKVKALRRARKSLVRLKRELDDGGVLDRLPRPDALVELLAALERLDRDPRAFSDDEVDELLARAIQLLRPFLGEGGTGGGRRRGEFWK